VTTSKPAYHLCTPADKSLDTLALLSKMSSYILAINCGSSSIKSKLFLVPDIKDEALKAVADVTVKNIGSKGDKVKFKISWEDAEGTGKLGKDLEEDGEAGDAVECERQGAIYLSVPPR
jgi:hypothetical protein